MGMRTERQWRDLAHCLTLLPFSERGLRKMQENFECFGDKLTEDAVFNSFIVVIGKMRRGAKPELKALIDEFEQKLRACHSRGMENMDGFEENVAMPPPAAVGKSAKKNPAGKRQPLATRNGNAQEDDNFTTPKPRVSRPERSSRKKLAVTFSSDEESAEDDVEAELSEAETPKNTTPIRRTSRRTTRAK